MSLSRCLVVLSLTLLAGCGSTVERNVLGVTGHMEVDCGVTPAVDELVLENVKPEIVQIGERPYVALTMAGYAALSRNLAKIQASYKQRLAQLEFLRECIKAFNRRAKVSEAEG